MSDRRRKKVAQNLKFKPGSEFVSCTRRPSIVLKLLALRLLFGLVFVDAAQIAAAACFDPDAGADEPFGDCTLSGEELNWTPLRGRPYVIDGHVTVPPASELTIQAGTQIQLSSESALIVEGLLTAIGSASDPIRFDWEYAEETIRVDGHWPGIEFTGTSGGSRLVHSRLDGAVRCVVIKEAPEGGTGGATPQILNNIFTNCATHALYLEGSSARIENNLIVENAGIGIAIDRPENTEIRLTIAYNTIDLNAGGGIRFVGDNDPGTLVENNLVTRNGGYGWIGGANVTHKNNNVWGNQQDLPSPEPITPDFSSDPQYRQNYFRNRTLFVGSPSLTASSTGGEIGAYGGLGSPPDYQIEMVDAATVRGSLERNERWTGEILLTGTVTVDWPYRLEITPGTVVKIPADDEIRINSIAKIAGAADEPAVFESSGGGTRGTWGGLRLSGSAGVEHVRISGADRCIQTTTGVPLIKNSVITNCTDDGIYVTGGSPRITNNLIIESPGVGITLNGSDAAPMINFNTIDLNGSGGLDIIRADDDNTTIEANIITRNGVSGWSGGADVVRGFNNLWGNQQNYQGLGVRPSITDLLSDPKYVDPFFGSRALMSDSPAGTWSQDGEEIGAYGNGGSPLTYEVPMDDSATLDGDLERNERWSGDVVLEGSVTVDWPWRLEISPGTVVRIPAGERIRINSLAEIVGVSDDPVVFRPLEGGKNAGVWKGLQINGGSLVRHSFITGAERCIEMRDGVSLIADNRLAGCTEDAIYLYKGSPTIQNNLVVENADVGIGLYGSEASPLIRYNTIDLNGGDGIKFQYSDDEKTTIRNNIVSRNGGAGWSGGSAVTPGYNNVWRNSPDYLGTSPIGENSPGHLSSDPEFLSDSIGSRRLSALSSSLKASSSEGEIGAYGDGGSPPDGNVEVSLTPTLEGELTGNERWSGVIDLEGTVIVNLPWKLEIAPGTRVRIPSGEGLEIRGSGEISGTIDAPVTFELLADNGDTDPPPEPWQGLTLTGSTQINNSVFSGALRCVSVGGGAPVIKESLFQDCHEAAIYVSDGSPDIEHNLVVDNLGSGIAVYGAATPLISYNTIDGNEGVGLDFSGRSNEPETIVENNLITRNASAGWFGGDGVSAGFNVLWSNQPNYKSFSEPPATHRLAAPRYTACPTPMATSGYCISPTSDAKAAASDGGEVGRYGGFSVGAQSISCSLSQLRVAGGALSAGSYARYSESEVVLAGGGDGLQIQEYTSLVVRAPAVRILPNFSVQRGSRFVASVEEARCPEVPVTRTGSDLGPNWGAFVETPRREVESDVTSLRAPRRFENSVSFPLWLIDIFAQHGIDPAAIGSVQADVGRTWLVIETVQPLSSHDRNLLTDVYRLDLVTDQLLLVSASYNSFAGSGASYNAAASADAGVVVFESEAPDLVIDDYNGAADIFVYETDTHRVWRLTRSDFASKNPSLDGLGRSVAFDQRTLSGHRRILGGALLANAGLDELSLEASEQGLATDNHHPALSPDGRYLAYLEAVEVASAGDDQFCRVHIYDFDTGVYHLQPCPDGVPGDDEQVRLRFSDDAKALRVETPTSPDLILIDNPIAGP